MDDIAPHILELLKNRFKELYEKNDKIKKLLKLINEGNATYEEANEYAIELGEMLAKCYSDCISPEDLPDGTMYFNIAKRTVEPTMKNNFDLISNASTQVQKSLNDKAGIGLKVISPEINQYKIDSIINKVSSNQFEKVAFILQEPIVHFSQSIVDDTIKGNVELHSKTGLNPKITRKVRGGCCQWCMNLAGTYSYPDDVPKDVYRRHDRCRCEVLFDPGEGKVQNVHSKEWIDKDEKNERIRFSKLKNTLKDKSLRIINEKDIALPISIGARWSNYEVYDPYNDDVFHFVEGTKIQNVQIFAGKGVRKGLKYEVKEGLSAEFGGDPENWQHVKGFGVLDFNGVYRNAEVHWFQCEDIGRVRFKVKNWEDES